MTRSVQASATLGVIRAGPAVADVPPNAGRHHAWQEVDTTCSWGAILVLALSTAVMRLFDSFDGGFMNAPPTGAVAYPIRKMYYNFTITGLSVVVALPSAPSDSSRSWMIRCSGTTRRAPGSPRRDLNRVGFAIVAQFVIVW